ncbi:MAG: ChaN family lipoprotein [Chthonomonas sp.]|nr:ChaN family lipoprotein [Chthonomonas sp.]
MILAALLQVADVLMLPIEPLGTVQVGPEYTDIKSGKPSSPVEIAKASRGVQYLIFGESHDSKPHKEAVAEILRALDADGRAVVLGLEMFTRPNQPNLAPWTMGYWSEEQFQREARWKEEWGFDYSIYKPTFDAVKALRIPMVALNAPRDWVRTVSRQGWEALAPEIKAQLPPLDTSNRQHRLVFDTLMGGHPAGANLDRVYAAQTLWDTAMADSALKAMHRWPENPRRIMVILAGSGHALYKQAINYRLWQQAKAASVTVIGIDGKEPRRVRQSVGDFTLMR